MNRLTAPAPLRFGVEYRLDIQGVRAVAVLLVLLYHAGVPGFSGGFVGVDVFFVLSGYLITGIVAREVAETGRLSLKRFYGRRILRIIPAATIVLVTVAIFTALRLPITQWRSIAHEIVGSTFYFSNWQFAATTNYLNASAPPSPLQHFWSLAVEEQYYLLWPALLVIAMLLLRRRKGAEIAPRRLIRLAALIMVGTTAASFICAIVAMRVLPDAAYFITPTRLWELGVGSLLALAVPSLRRLSRRSAGALTATGLVSVLGAGVFYDASVPFPGVTALLPVLGTAAMLAGGVGAQMPALSATLLGNRAMVWIGGISYSLYLWHWPMLIIGQQGFGLTGPLSGALLVGCSVIPAYLSTRLMEQPIASNAKWRRSPRRAFTVGAIAALCSLLGAGGLLLSLDRNTQPPIDVNLTEIGAATLEAGEQPLLPAAVPRTLIPSLVDAKNDIPAVYDQGCHLEVPETALNECEFGDLTGATVLLVGDSHAAQWFSALESLAESNGFRLVSMTKSSCPFVQTTIELTSKDRPYTECAEWNDNVRDYIERERPAAIVTSTLGIYVDAARPDDPEAFEQSLRQSWAWVSELGIPLFAIVDSPYMSTNVPDCLAKNRNAPENCGTPREEALPHAGLERRAAEGLPGVTPIDLTDLICPGDTCLPIIGGVLVYRDQHHLSDVYVRTLAPALGSRAPELISAARQQPEQ